MSPDSRDGTGQIVDCRSEIGVTIGLIDGIIAVSRVLAARDLSAPEVCEALKDLRADEDLNALLTERTPQAD